MDAKILTDMFYLSVPWIEKILRPIFIYIFLVVALRAAGKRELAQLNPFDLVVLLTLSNTVQNAIIGEDSTVTGGIIGAVSLLFTNYVVVRLLYRHARLEQMVVGSSDALIENGQVNLKRIKDELITIPELESAARKQGFTSLQEVERAVIEPGGSIVFTSRKPDPDEIRQRELLARLDEITRELASLRASPPPSNPVQSAA